MFVAKDLHIGYGPERKIFGAINFALTGGEFVALLGVNGIGKSTLLRTISGLQKKVSGSIELDGRELDGIPVLERAKLLSIVLTERIVIEHITVRQFIALGRAPYTNWMGKLSEEDAAIVESVVTTMKMESLQHRQFGELSDGEKQKTMIARALCQQTPVIILDEPTAFLDFRNRPEVLDMLAKVSRELKKTIILSTHDIDAALTYCNKFWLMTEDSEFCEITKGEDYRDIVSRKLFGEGLRS